VIIPGSGTATGTEATEAREALSIWKISRSFVLVPKTIDLKFALPIMPRKPFAPPILLFTSRVWFPVPSKFPVRFSWLGLVFRKSAPKANTGEGKVQVIVVEALLASPSVELRKSPPLTLLSSNATAGGKEFAETMPESSVIV